MNTLPKKQLLIVEDNELNRKMLAEILSGQYDLLEAENGQAALDLLAQHSESVALILLDIIMPVMDGYTFLRKLKADEQLATIPVIVMTQGNTEEDEVTALANGANDFIPKPYRPKVILHRVASMLRLYETAAISNLYKYDRLTGFYTREYFYEKVHTRLDEYPDREYSIWCLNIENFKLYNDTFGRQAGDHLLAAEAEFLRRKVGEDIICGRYGADRLLCLLERRQEQELRQHISELLEYSQQESTQKLSIKIGIYEITDRSIPAAYMCDRALLAVDRIKGLYNETVAVYDDSMRENMLREKHITDVMEASLQAGEFSVYFQPKYCLQNDRMIGAEALVRWTHPDLGFLPPNEFIPLFEKNGFIYKLDQYVWKSVCDKLCEWRDKGLPLVPISVNISRTDIYQADLPAVFTELVKDSTLDPKYLHLEITESAYTKSPERIIHTVSELRDLGFTIEMDDFGSGYSSLNMLSQMSIDILKLDMAFIRSEMAKPIERRLLNDVVNMAHRMRLSVVAEGVETEDQRDRLKSMGCDFAQGYYYAKPLPADEFEKLLLMSKDEDNTQTPVPDQDALYGLQRTGLHEGSPDMLYKLNQISDALPGGFFIYKADKSEELLSFNRELVKIFECDTAEEFRELTGNSFHGMVHPDDRSLVEHNISSQITKDNDIDSVKYRIVCKNGDVKYVLDYGRFVHTDAYGDLYYVLINDITPYVSGETG